MRLSALAAIVLLSCPLSVTHAQFRGQEPRVPSVSDQVRASESGNLLLGFINPDNFRMSHSVSMSYMSMGGQGVGVSMYTNSMMYKIADPLTVRADVSLMFTPFGSASSLFRQDAGRIFLNRAQVDYTPSKDTRISLSFRQFPYDYANPYLYGRGISGSFGVYGHDDWP